ncbi:E3 ubiquitin-protein ligase TRAIP-like [Quillaja saponaria]|uniref:E3 ubiquitin-protein ligase TRAIP-like n=1 Tax=Quillaja saponaria TaxID=32244 RepID=A0AAD7LS85_QUISA|nr:E3 ubiquitin-protein ligase TRAIP-like [Quillaja saponaria]
MVNGSNDNNNFGKTICSICYEDLKPIVEDLQSISICGHVFHELCLQQWFEYCSSTKKYSCPVCKQGCKASNVGRLYFQSVGDVSEPVLPQKPIDREEDAEVWRREVKRLEVKVSGLSSSLESQGKEISEITKELCTCKEQTKLEATLKNEALKENASMRQLLHRKSTELDRSTLECLRLQDRNMALAKELAAFKLMSDLDLDEEEILKLAALGNGANNKDTIDILRKSLVMRNRTYKELMTKCNLLGRGEARYSKKLEKAKEKINKLKARVQELETAVEVKENEILRFMKVLKRASRKKVSENDVNCYSNSLPAHNFVLKDQGKELSTPKLSDGQTGNLTNKPLQPLKVNKDADFSKEGRTTMSLIEETDDCILIDMDPGVAKQDSKHLYKTEAANEARIETIIHGLGTLVEPLIATPASAMEEEVTVLDDVTQVSPKLNIQKEYPSPSTLSRPGDACFSGGLLAPDGTHRFLGKWCKRGQNNGSISTNGSTNGELIAVGADGRGGRVKVLRSSNQSSLDCKENLVGAKRFKIGSKTSDMKSQGCLQIDHFFGRVGN